MAQTNFVVILIYFVKVKYKKINFGKYWVDLLAPWCRRAYVTIPKLTLITCHKSPSNKCCFPLPISSACMLTMVQPMELAELTTRMLFSCVLKAFSFVLLMARSSIVFGTDRLIILLKRKRRFMSNSMSTESILWTSLPIKSNELNWFTTNRRRSERV